MTWACPRLLTGAGLVIRSARSLAASVALMVDRDWGFRTRALHAGGRPDLGTGARTTPIYYTSAFVFEDTADAADLFALQKYGSIYTRISNPTVNVFEERMANLEGGIGAVATSSGQSAQFLALTSLAGAGDHITSAAGLYGGTYMQFDVTLRRLGIDTTFVRSSDPDDFAAAIGDRTKLLFTEIIANPAGEIADLSGLAEVAQRPPACRWSWTRRSPRRTSAGPWSSGPTSSCTRPRSSSAGTAPPSPGWSPRPAASTGGRAGFPSFTEPVASYNGLRWWDNFGEYAFCTRLRAEQMRDVGACLSPFDAFFLLGGLETLPLRMDAHVANARAVAEWLDADDRVAWVRWAGLPDHPHHERAQQYLPEGTGLHLHVSA